MSDRRHAEAAASGGGGRAAAADLWPRICCRRRNTCYAVLRLRRCHTCSSLLATTKELCASQGLAGLAAGATRRPASELIDKREAIETQQTSPAALRRCIQAPRRRQRGTASLLLTAAWLRTGMCPAPDNLLRLITDSAMIMSGGRLPPVR